MVFQQYLTLNNGHKMPIVGLGTFLGKPGEVETSVEEALEMGYRHFDTAFMYANEAAAGKTLNKWLTAGKIRRDELFIVTKLPLFGNTRQGPEEFLQKSLNFLGLDYVDLYLIHAPIGVKHRSDKEMWPMTDQGLLDVDMGTDLVAVWKGMEDQVRAGKAKSIGLSNFSESQIQRILDNSTIRPANLQVEIHAYFQQRKLRAFCESKGITLCAYAPLGSKGRAAFYQSMGRDISKIPDLLDNEVVKKIAQRHRVTPSQVLLRHLTQEGVAVIPKSSSAPRIQLNYQIFNFNLSPDELVELGNLDQGPAGRTFLFDIPGADKHPEFPKDFR